MGFYISVKETGMKAHRPINVIEFTTGYYFIENRIAMATVLSDQGEAEELARIIRNHHPAAHCKILYTKCDGLSLQALKKLRG